MHHRAEAVEKVHKHEAVERSHGRKVGVPGQLVDDLVRDKGVGANLGDEHGEHEAELGLEAHALASVRAHEVAADPSLEHLDVPQEEAEAAHKDKPGHGVRLVDEHGVEHDAGDVVEHTEEQRGPALILHLEDGEQDDGQLLDERHREERRHVVVEQVRQDDDVEEVVSPSVVVRHQAAVVEGAHGEVHDAVPDEEDGEVPRDVLLVAQRRGEAVFDQVVKEVHAEERRDAGGVEGEVPGVVREPQQPHEVVDEDAHHHVQPEDGEILLAEPDVLLDKAGELVHHSLRSHRDRRA